MDRHQLICTDRTDSTIEESRSLHADCANCKGLCCILLPFDADQGFGFDKPAAVPCQHLDTDFKCSIHASLMDDGFSGCVQFDCSGAGQNTTAKLGLGEHWFKSEALLQQAYSLFLEARSPKRTIHGRRC